jgi:hypothetical protein
MKIFGMEFGRQRQQQAEGMTLSELAGALLEVSPELREAYTRADIELALDDRGWLNNKNYFTPENDSQTRTVLVGKSRLYWLRDPLAKQAVRLWTDYALGTGITFASEDAATQTAITAFMKDRRNRRVTSSEGQRKLSKKLLIDGEIFFAVFMIDGKKVIRCIDPIQITHIITNPEDSEHILGYRRAIPGINGTQGKAVYYADWTADDEDRALGEQQKVFMNENISFEDDVVVYHLPFDCVHQRGNGLLSSVVDWSREHRRFMEARVAITQALSKYAYKLTAKGGQATLNAIKARVESTYASTPASTVEKKPQPAPGGTFAQNQALDLEAAPRMTGAGDSEKDGNQLKLMICSGTGIMLHYFGDPSTGNLATATAMELPMLKMFYSYQELWKDAWVDIFTIVMDVDSNDGIDDALEDLKLTIELPPILDSDLTALGSALTSIAGLWPEIAESDEVLTLVLTSLEVPNVEDVLKQLRVVRKQLKAENDAKEKAANDAIAKGAAAGAPMTKLKAKEAEELTAALNKVAEVLS